MILLDTGALTLLGIGMLCEVELLGPKHLLAAENNQEFIVWQSEHLVRGQYPPSPDALGIAVLRDDLRQSEALPGGHSGVYLHRHVPAAGAEILRRHIVGGAQQNLGVGVTQQFCP